MSLAEYTMRWPKTTMELRASLSSLVAMAELWWEAVGEVMAKVALDWRYGGMLLLLLPLLLIGRYG